MRVEPETYPRLRLALEVLRAAERLDRLRERRLHREIHVPALVAHLVDASHASLAQQSRDLVEAHHDVADLPLLAARFARGGNRRGDRGGETALGIGRGRRSRFDAEGGAAASATEGTSGAIRGQGGRGLACRAGHAHGIGHGPVTLTRIIGTPERAFVL